MGIGWVERVEGVVERERERERELDCLYLEVTHTVGEEMPVVREREWCVSAV